MTRLSRRPSRKQSRHFASALSLFFLACLALLLVCPVAVKADEEADKYGPVIGIGACFVFSGLPSTSLTVLDRSRYNVSRAGRQFGCTVCLPFNPNLPDILALGEHRPVSIAPHP